MWEIVGTTFQKNVTEERNNVVPTNGTDVPKFSENLLRTILALTQEQRLELISDFAAGEITKGKKDSDPVTTFLPVRWEGEGIRKILII